MKPRQCGFIRAWALDNVPIRQSQQIGVFMKDRAPSTLEVIGVAFLAMAVPIFVIVGAIAYGLFQG